MNAKTLADAARAFVASRWAPLVLFVIAPLIVFPSALLRTGLMDGGDDALSNLPFLTHSARMLLRGELLWTTDLWMGTSLVQEPEFGTFYLPRLMLLLFSPTLGFGLYVGAHYVIAECGAYLYAREVGLSRVASIFGALAYAFAGFMLGHRGHTMYVVAGAFTPFVLYSLARACEHGGRRSYAAAAFGFAAIVFSGAVQLAVYLALMIGVLHAALSWFHRSWRPLQVATIALVPGVMLASLQILPSLGYVQQLQVTPRMSYAFATELSWSPALFPTLVLPESPQSHAELYSRCGAAVLSAALVAVIAPSSRGRPLVRAWGLVAIVAIVLMLGKHVPFVAHALHALPVIDVFRAPCRHNFELGVALSFLGACGVEVIARSEGREVRRAAMIASGVVLALSLSGLVERNMHFADPALRTLVDYRVDRIVVAASIALAFVVAAGFTRAGRGVAVAAIAIAPLIESRIAQKIELAPWPPIPHALPSLATTPGETARIIPPHLADARTEALTGNSVLLIDGAQHLYGYASMAPRDVAEVLGLDMHGHAEDLPDLIFSRLPSIYGVTHVIMPELVCGELRVAVDPNVDSGSACIVEPPMEVTLSRGERHCIADLGAGKRRFALAGELRSTSTLRPSVTFGVYAAGVQGAVASTTIGGERLASGALSFSVPIDLTRCPPRPRLMVEPTGAGTIEARGLSLVDDAPIAVAVLSAVDVDTLVFARAHDAMITLGPTPEVARAERSLDTSALSSSSKELRLEVVARATSAGTTPRLVVDLYDGDAFDPDAAQLVIEGDALSTVFRTFTLDFKLDSLPPRVSLRVMAEGGAAIDVGRARLFSITPHPVVSLTSSEVLRGRAYSINGDTLQLAPGGTAVARVSLPMRPIVLTIDAESDGKSDAPLVFGITPVDGTSPIEGSIAADRLAGHHRFSQTIVLPADVARAELYTHTDSERPVLVHGLTAQDGCVARRYEKVRPVGGGLTLYRSLEARPRVFTVQRLVAARGLAEARAILRDGADFDPATTAVVEANEASHALFPATIADVSIAGSTVELDVDAPQGDAFVVINDRFDPAWVATLDGVPATIHRTNALVRGVLVPKGRHHLHMHCRAPIGLWVGGALFAIGCAVLAWVVARVDRLGARAPLPLRFLEVTDRNDA